MKVWMIELYYIILFSTLAGTMAYAIWCLVAYQMAKGKKLRYIYPMLVSVMAFFLLPCFCLWIRLIYLINIKRLVVGEVLLCTQGIVILRCVLAVVWLIGMFVAIALRLRKIWKMQRMLINDVFPAEEEIVQRKDRIAKELHLKTRIEVYRSFVVPSPLVSGVWKKQVFLPDKKYDQKDLEAILYHELVHIKQRVVNIKFFILLLQVIHWFNPCTYLFMKSMDEWGETACDLAVHFDTKCTLTFKEYFYIVLKGIGVDQIDMPDSATQFQKTKGVDDRVNILKNYKREKDFKLAGGILAMAMFLTLSTSTAMAAGTGIEYAHSSIYRVTDTENSIQLTESEDVIDDYIEYKEYATDRDEEDVIEILIKQRASGQFTFDPTFVPAGKLAHSKLFSVEEGGKIVLTVSVDPDDVSVKAGIINPDGSKLYIRGEDLISYTFTAETKGDYRIYIDNDSDTDVTVHGSVVYK